MSKTLQVARREFLSTVSTKGFIVGTLIFPAIMIVAIMVIPKLLTDESPAYVGKVVVVDRTGWEGADGRTLTERLAYAMSEEGRAAKRARQAAAAAQAARAQAEGAAGEEAGRVAEDMTRQAVEQSPQDESEVEIVELPPDADLEREKEKLWQGSPFEGGMLALIVIDEHAVTPEEIPVADASDQTQDAGEGEDQPGEGPSNEPETGDTGRGEPETEPEAPAAIWYGTYESFVRTKLDDRFQDPLREDLNEVIVGARIEAAEYDAAKIGAMFTVRPPRAVEVTEQGERDRAGSDANVLIAMGFMVLLWISVMTGGQYLMTTVITEKSNRVMEVLLSAVSPTQLMTGKIIGQMGVAMAILGIYLTIGMVALDQFDRLYLIETKDLALMGVYFLLAFFFLATAMAAIGSAVTEIMEANALITPVMMVLIIPWLLFVPLSQNPNSVFATVMGLVPPISPFAMVIREAGTDPIPVWQHVAAIGIGIVAVFGAIWATSKIFRIGVLMYGKPPDLRTLVRWVRMA